MWILIRKSNNHSHGSQSKKERVWQKGDVVSGGEDTDIIGTRDGEAHGIIHVPGAPLSEVEYLLVDHPTNSNAKREKQLDMGALSVAMTGPERAQFALTGVVALASGLTKLASSAVIRPVSP